MLSTRTHTSESKREKSSNYSPEVNQLAREVLSKRGSAEDHDNEFWNLIRSNRVLVYELARFGAARALSEEKNKMNREISRQSRVWDRKRRKGLNAFGWMLPNTHKPIGEATAEEVSEAAKYYEKQGEATAAAFAEKAQAMMMIYQRVSKSGKILVKDALREDQLGKLLPVS